MITLSAIFGAPQSEEVAYCRMRETSIVIALYIAYYFVFTYTTGYFGVVSYDVIGLTIAGIIFFLVKHGVVLLGSSIVFFLYVLIIFGYAAMITFELREVGNSILISSMLLYVAYRALRAGWYLYKNPSPEMVEK